MGAILMFSLVICIALIGAWINWRDEKREKSAKKQV